MCLAVPTTKRKKESSFAILAEAPVSRPTSPRSLPVDIKTRRVSPFRGRGFREETSRHNTPKTSAANSRANSPPRRRTNSLSRIDNMAQTATLPLPIHNLPRPHSPRNFLKENIEEVREISELNREKHEAEAERKRIEEEEAILKEMGVLDKSKSGSKSLVTSRTNSRSNSPSKINLKSRDSSPAAIIHFENIPANNKEFVNPDDGIRKPVTHKSRVRSVSKSQPQSNNGSPKHSKIPKRQSSVSPTRTTTKRASSMSRRPLENNLNRNQRFISSSTSSIHETIRIGSQVHDKRASKSTQHLSISPAHIKGKPPISPGRGGPPPSNRTINAKRLSPIVGTPNKSPIDDLKPSSARTTPKPTPMPRKTVKTAGNTPATSRLNSRQPSRAVSRDPSPDKRKTKPPVTKTVTNAPTKPVSRTPSTRTTQKPAVTSKPEPKKPISRTNSVKSLTRAPSTKNLAEKPPLKKTNSRKDISDKSNSTNKINEVGRKDSVKEPKKTPKGKDEDKAKAKSTRSTDSMTDDNVVKQDNETQYDKITNEKGELVIMTKKNIISMTTAAITSQPLELVSTVTNQLPAAFEKAREKGIFERLSSKESLVGKEDVPDKPEKPATHEKDPPKEKAHKRIEHKEKEKEVEEKVEEKRPPRHNKNNFDKPIFTEDQMKLRLLQPPYNNPQVERAKQKIEAILKEPEVSTENILTASAKSRELKKTMEDAVDKTKAEAEKVKDEAESKLTDIKDQAVKQNEKMTEEIRSEVTKIVDSIITPVEQPKDIIEKKDNIKDIVKKVEQAKKDIEPIVTVVNEKKKNGGADIAEKVNETLVKGEGDIEVQSSNLSTPGVDKIKVQKKLGDGNGSDRSAQSNGGAVPTTKRKKESSFAILAEAPVSRPTSPRSLPVDIKTRRVSPFRGRGFREETSRHNTPKTSAANSRANSPPRRRTNSLSRIDNMAQTATLPLPIHNLPRPHSPRNFLKENIEEVREISELNREKHEAEAERKRIEEEEAILKEMGVLDKSKSGSKSLVTSRTNSRSNSPSKINLKSRDSSPAAIIHFENIPANNKEFVNPDDGIRKPVTHKSRVRSVSKSQPQSNNGSPKHSKIPKRQSSVSPTRTTTKRASSMSRRPLENNLNRNQRFISSSTSSIHETIRIGSQVHDKRASKSTQHLSISPAHIKGKPPISPGRGGPPPSNRTINAKRLSPIVGTPNKSPIDDLKPSSARTTPKPTPMPRKTVKTAGNTPATSRLNSRQPSRAVSRDPSPDKRKTKPPVTKTVTNAPTKPVSRTPSTRTTQKPAVTSKPEPKKPISRTNSVKSLTRAPSTKNLAEKPPLKKTNSRKDISDKSNSTNKINEVGRKDSVKEPKKTPKGKDEDKAKAKSTRSTDSMTDDNVVKQDNETQYDKITNEKGELVIMTKKNIISMTTAAITSQPLELVSTVTNQLPAAFEKAREKGIFERLSSKESLVGKEDVPDKPEKPATHEKDPPKEKAHKRIEHKEKEKEVEEKVEEKRPPRHNKNNFDKPIFTEDQMKLRLLQPPYNNPQVERAKQKIEAILKEPEVSTENILTASAKSRELKKTMEDAVDKTKAEAEKVKDEAESKLTDIKDQAVKQNEKMTEEIRSEVTKIVDSIITPVEQPKDIIEKKDNIKDIVKKVEQAKKDIEPIVTVVNEKKKNGGADIAEKVNETLVKGEGDIEVQSSNLSTPGVDKIKVQKKLGDGNGSDRSAQSNGGFPQSTSTTPRPPARTKKEAKETPPEATEASEPTQTSEDKPKDPNFCQRLMKKCKSRCCACCTKGEDSDDEEKVKDKDKERKTDEMQEGKKGVMSKLNCCKKGVDEEKAEQEIRDMERAAGKASIEYENETKPKRTLRDIFCGCCGRRRRVADTGSMPRNVAESMSPAPEETGCCGRKKRHIERRDSILSDRPPTSCCNNRLCTWLTGMCRRSSEQSSSRRTSMFSKNKSMSPTLPPENPNYPITMDRKTTLAVTPVPSPRPSIQISPRGTPNPSPMPSRKASRIVITKDFMKKDVDIEEEAEDTRKKLDTSLVEHTSVMRGAIPVLPIVLAYFCLLCNIIVPGLGSILSGMFCLCFGIPRFGVHDGAKHRIGSFVINLLVGCGQMFTVLFCLVGWGWSIWWGVIMVKTSRKYRKLKREAAAAEAEAAPPVTSNNHTRA
uniref:Uncharacterized protein n=1 Tax=Heliothis virescens TaxID=7102 RepID=A0A2A4K907_HELVI